MLPDHADILAREEILTEEDIKLDSHGVSLFVAQPRRPLAKSCYKTSWIQESEKPT